MLPITVTLSLPHYLSFIIRLDPKLTPAFHSYFPERR